MDFRVWNRLPRVDQLTIFYLFFFFTSMTVRVIHHIWRENNIELGQKNRISTALYGPCVLGLLFICGYLFSICTKTEGNPFASPPVRKYNWPQRVTSFLHSKMELAECCIARNTIETDVNVEHSKVAPLWPKFMLVLLHFHLYFKQPWIIFASFWNLVGPDNSL